MKRKEVEKAFENGNKLYYIHVSKKRIYVETLPARLYDVHPFIDCIVYRNDPESQVLYGIDKVHPSLATLLRRVEATVDQCE